MLDGAAAHYQGAATSVDVLPALAGAGAAAAGSPPPAHARMRLSGEGAKLTLPAYHITRKPPGTMGCPLAMLRASKPEWTMADVEQRARAFAAAQRERELAAGLAHPASARSGSGSSSSSSSSGSGLFMEGFTGSRRHHSTHGAHHVGSALVTTSVPSHKDVNHILDSQLQVEKGSYSVLCRRGCVIVAFPMIGALICREEAWLFQEGMDEDGAILKATLDPSLDAERSAAAAAAEAAAVPAPYPDTFEYTVLAALLNVANRHIRLDIEACERLTDREVRQAKEAKRDPFDTSSLQTTYKVMGEVMTKVKTAQAGILAALECIEELHGNEEDTAGLVVSLDRLVLVPEGSEEEKSGLAATGSGSSAAAAAAAAAAEGLPPPPLVPVPSKEFLYETKEMEELLEWEYGVLASLRDRSNRLVRTLEEQQGNIKIGIDVQANELTHFQIKIQMITMAFGMCSMVSGFFGMNLSNGWCGPEGCDILGTTDSGRGGFAIVVFSTIALVVPATVAFYYCGAAKVELRALYYAVCLACLVCILTLKNLNIYYPSTRQAPW